MVLYVGGMVELFYASPKKETVFLKQRKGFVKLALGLELIWYPCTYLATRPH